MKHNTVPKWARIIGYLIAIAVTSVILVVLNNLPNWRVPFITSRYTDCLWAINLSIGASIGALITYIVYDPAWFRHLAQAVLNIFSVVAIYTLYRVFPFDFGVDAWNQLVRMLLFIGLILWPLFFVIELAQAVRDLARLVESPDLATVDGT